MGLQKSQGKEKRKGVFSRIDLNRFFPVSANRILTIDPVSDRKSWEDTQYALCVGKFAFITPTSS